MKNKKLFLMTLAILVLPFFNSNLVNAEESQSNEMESSQL